MLDVKRLALLREVALHGSLKSAARALGLSSSAISQQLTRLEHDTDVVLLEPLGRGVQLTPIAKDLVQRTERIMEQLEASESAIIESRSNPREVVTIAGFNTFAIEKLPQLIQLLERTHPMLTLEFTQLDPAEAMDELIARRADIILADEYPSYPLPPGRGLIRRNVATEPIAAYLPAATNRSAQSVSTLESLQQLIWVMEPNGSEANLWARNVCRAVGFEPTVHYQSPNLQVLLRLVEQGIAAAFLPRHIAATSAIVLEECTLFPSNLARTVHTVIRRGTERRPGITVCLRAIETLYETP